MKKLLMVVLLVLASACGEVPASVPEADQQTGQFVPSMQAGSASVAGSGSIEAPDAGADPEAIEPPVVDAPQAGQGAAGQVSVPMEDSGVRDPEPVVDAVAIEDAAIDPEPIVFELDCMEDEARPVVPVGTWVHFECELVQSGTNSVSCEWSFAPGAPVTGAFDPVEGGLPTETRFLATAPGVGSIQVVCTDGVSTSMGEVSQLSI